MIEFEKWGTDIQWDIPPCTRKRKRAAKVLLFACFVLFSVTPINQFLIILGRCTLYTPVCLQDESTCMRIEPV